MEQVFEILKTAFAKSFGAALGAVIVYGALALIVAMLAVPAWLLLKRRTGISVEARNAIVQEIDNADRVVQSLYQFMIYFAIAAMSGLAAFFYLVLPEDSSRDFLLFYGGVLYLIGMLWATGQLWYVRRRRSGEPARSIRSALSELGSRIEFNVQTQPQTFVLDHAALERAAAHIAAGGSIEGACEVSIPGYVEMDQILKAALRQGLETALATRPR